MNSVVGRRTWRLPKRRFFCRLRLLWVGIEGGGGWVLLFLCQNQLETLHVRLVSENKRESGEEEGNCNARPWSNVCDGGFDSLFFFYLYSSRHSHRINHRSVSIIQTPNQKKKNVASLMAGSNKSWFFKHKKQITLSPLRIQIVL